MRSLRGQNDGHLTFSTLAAICCIGSPSRSSTVNGLARSRSSRLLTPTGVQATGAIAEALNPRVRSNYGVQPSAARTALLATTSAWRRRG